MKRKTDMMAATIVAVLIGHSLAGAAEEAPVAKHARIETSLGTITVELYPDEAPKTVANFVKLAQQSFYDGLIIHRVIPHFMIQTGDPTGTGAGGPGYTFEDEISPTRKHDRPGRLSMANRGPNTNGSQFFITQVPAPWLDGKHTIFGQVIAGQEIVDKIANVPRDERDRPTTSVKLLRVVIVDGSHAP